MNLETIRSYKELDAWQAGMKLAEACYRALPPSPREGLRDLAMGIQGLATSIPGGVAAGFSTESEEEFAAALEAALGDTRQLETNVLLAERLGLIEKQAAAQLVADSDQVFRQLRRLRREL